MVKGDERINKQIKRSKDKRHDIRAQSFGIEHIYRSIDISIQRERRKKIYDMKCGVQSEIKTKRVTLME